MEKVFENKHAEIYDIRDEIPDTVFAYWKDYLSIEDQSAIDACEESLTYFKDQGIKIMISDHKYLEGATVEFLDWLHDYYFPTSVKHGLKAEIVLGSDNFIGNVSLDLMYDEEDLNKNLKDNTIFTPKVDTLENAKILAKQLLEKYNA